MTVVVGRTSRVLLWNSKGSQHKGVKEHTSTPRAESLT